MSISKINNYELIQQHEYPTAKVNWTIDANKTVLLIHDMQDYFLSFYGANSVLIASVIEHIKQLKQWAKDHNVQVYYSAQPQKQSTEDRGLLTDMWGKGLTEPDKLDQENITASIAPEDNDIILEKWRYSAFYRTQLGEDMQNQKKDQIIICGVYAHIGVLQTASVAFMDNIKPFVVEDAVADFSREDHIFALNYVQRNLGKVVTTAEIIRS